MKQIDNYKDFLSFIKSLDKKPRLLLHVCCAPCSTHCLELLLPYFDITVYYSNDNIMNYEEYSKRIKELEKYINTRNYDVDVIDPEYKPNDYFEAIKGKEDLGEKSIRCYECYKLRLEKSCLYAKENNYDFFTTTLSISPYKVTKWINEIGYMLEEKYNMNYLFSDFKKDEGYKDSNKLSKEYNLYCQCFCGCIYSYKEREEKIKNALNEKIKDLV